MLKNFDGNNKLKKFKIIFIIVVIIGVVVALFWGTRESNVTLTDNTIKISGMYGISINAEEIKEISLRDEIPKITRRLNGFSLLNIKKGIFKADQMEKIRLYLHSTNSPYIQITTNEDIIIINYGDPEKTQSVYSEIMNIK